MKNNYCVKIPAYISEWTDKYFHQSAYNIPAFYPKKKVLNFLSCFKRNQKIKLFRGINKFNKNTSGVISWTYNREIAENYIKDGGEIIEKSFCSNEVLLDTTILNSKQKKLLGYDYKIDDKEVLILKI